MESGSNWQVSAGVAGQIDEAIGADGAAPTIGLKTRPTVLGSTAHVVVSALILAAVTVVALVFADAQVLHILFVFGAALIGTGTYIHMAFAHARDVAEVADRQPLN